MVVPWSNPMAVMWFVKENFTPPSQSFDAVGIKISFSSKALLLIEEESRFDHGSSSKPFTSSIGF